jgi:hypothetical protein
MCGQGKSTSIFSKKWRERERERERKRERGAYTINCVDEKQ